MDAKQVHLLEYLFANSDCFQRIGDKNQAIFSDRTKESATEWKDRDTVKELKGSQRLNKNIAKIVSRFGITNQNIIGNKKNEDGSEIDIKPIMLVYKENEIGLVIPAFIKIIKGLNDKLPNGANYAAIGWRKNIEDNTKISIGSYWSGYQHEDIKEKIDYKCLTDYLLNFDKSNNAFEDIRKQILNALLKILRLENIKDKKQRIYTKRSLISDLQCNENQYEEFKGQLFLWCKLVLNQNLLEAKSKIKDYLPKLLSFLQPQEQQIQLKKETTQFIDTITSAKSQIITQDKENNKYPDSFVDLTIQSVHSAKGKTYTGILYLETFYQKLYDSERLKDYFIDKNFSDKKNKNTYETQNAKIVYVGFSRPTHLLCFAVQEDRFTKNFEGKLNSSEWDVIEINNQH